MSMREIIAPYVGSYGGKVVLGVVLAILGMAVVFIVLYVISLMIDLFGVIFKQKKVPPMPVVPAAPAVSQTQAAPAGDSGELIAVITAAVSAFFGRSSSLTVSPYATSSAWSAASKAQNTRNLQK